MQSIPKQLSKDFQDNILLNSKVTNVDERENDVILSLEDGKILNFTHLIVATEAPQTATLFPELRIETSRRVVTTIYYQTRDLSFKDKYLLLNGSGEGRVNHIAFLSQIAPHYSPPGKNLISVNVIDVECVDPEVIKKEVNSWGIFSTKNWKHLKTYPINYAQPNVFYKGRVNFNRERITFAGDFTQTPSIEGSMKSGELAALKLAD